jgi:O-antigen/teichoic acid export membrane protein
VSIAEHDRPGLDLFGHVLFLLACAAVVTAIAAVIHPDGAAPLVLVILLGVYIGLVGASCFLRGYQRGRRYYETVTAPPALTESDETAIEELLQ